MDQAHGGPSGLGILPSTPRTTSEKVECPLFFFDTDGIALYGYDETGQLKTADHSTQSDESYDYDKNGNRKDGSFTAGAYNRLASDGTYTYDYDHEGNRTLRTKVSDGSYTVYEWDYRNRLVSVTDYDNSDVQLQLVEYGYDFANRLISRTLQIASGSPETGHFVYDGSQMTLVFGADGNISNRLFGGTQVDETLADEVYSTWNAAAAGNVYWLLGDNQQTIRDVVQYNAGTDTTTVVNHRVFDSFGKLVSETPSAPAVVDLGYTGRWYDRATGLQWNLNRWYDPATHNWISEDPIGFAAGDANLQRYVGNGPTNAVDPQGLIEVGAHTKEAIDAYRGIPQPIRRYLFGEIVGESVAEMIRAQAKFWGEPVETPIPRSFKRKGVLATFCIGGRHARERFEAGDPEYTTTRLELYQELKSVVVEGAMVVAPVGEAPLVARETMAIHRTTRAGNGFVPMGSLDMAALEAGSFEEAAALQGRAQLLHDVRGANMGTTSVIRVKNRLTTHDQTWIAIEAPQLKIPARWEGQLLPNERFIGGYGHAEETIMRNLGNDWYVVSGGTSVNVCKGTCAPMLQERGVQLGGPIFKTSTPRNTPYRMFWRSND